MRLKWHCNRKLERVSLVIADQPGANDDDSAPSGRRCTVLRQQETRVGGGSFYIFGDLLIAFLYQHGAAIFWLLYLAHPC